MRFWDSSAIVPLIVEEACSSACRSLLRTDRALAVWTLSRVEVLSALWREVRAGAMERTAATQAGRRLDALSAAWTEVDGIVPVRDRAERLVAVHPLRAADALQLAAALVLSRERPRWPFVTGDRQLAGVAELEGFDVIVPEG
ncbi:MAG: type II toxin-antitoxin system VapC family toxin [Polyangia bacterium]|jgi:predicted nucleic acid-binding protein